MVAFSRTRTRRSTLGLPWWKRFWAKVTAIPVVALLGLAYAYKTTGANELRTEIYQPLFSDLIGVEAAIQGVNPDGPPFLKALAEIERTGALERVPSRIRRRLAEVREKASAIHSAVHNVRELVLREVSSRITQIRSEEIDRDWQQRAVGILREQARSKKGIADSVMFTMNHEGRSRSVDVRDPKQPVITGPGGPTFVVRDWLTYPASVGTIEALWAEVDYLYFNEHIDAWYYQLTREDLKRLNLSLTQFLKPIAQVLSQNGDFRTLARSRPDLLATIADLRLAVIDRIRDPKQLRDLIWG